MYNVEFSPGADAAFAALQSGDAIEVLQKLDVVEKTGVQREVVIGVVNFAYFVHVLSPPCLSNVITIHDSRVLIHPILITVTHIDVVGGWDLPTKQRFVTEAATAIGVIPTNIQVF